MEKVLIVAKTHLDYWHACIGGLNLSARRNVRLLLPGGSYPSSDTTLQIGQIWSMDLSYVPDPTPPHVENAIMLNKVYIRQMDDIRTTLLRNVQPWMGGLAQLFDGCLQIGSGSCYISHNTNLPSCSTGFWLAPHPLVLKYYEDKKGNNKAYYHLRVPGNTNQFYLSSVKIPYVGFADPIPEIPANTLVRVSLARWWAPEGFSEKRCYLQISGWYFLRLSSQ